MWSSNRPTRKGVRGHTMYHRDSAGSISYAEFRHLGKEGVLGRYSLHFHLVGDTMRGSSVIGASIWDSGNRWITIHGTNYLVVRDCVGYQSVGHGFFLEDGTEVYNVLDRNLAVQAFLGKTAAEAGAAVRPQRRRRASGGPTASTRSPATSPPSATSTATGFEARKTTDFDPRAEHHATRRLVQRTVDIRTLPFIRFEDNEAHCQRRHSFNLGGGAPFGPPNVAGVGPDMNHPFILRNTRLWNVHWGIHPVSPSLLIDQMEIYNAEYGVWRPEYKDHYYRQIAMTDVPDKTQYAFISGKLNAERDYPAVDAIRDDLPPSTVITFIGGVHDGKSSSAARPVTTVTCARCKSTRSTPS